MRKLRKLPQKACGPNGISYAMLKNLPIEGVTDLCRMMRRWELAGRLPDQVVHHFGGTTSQEGH